MAQCSSQGLVILASLVLVILMASPVSMGNPGAGTPEEPSSKAAIQQYMSGPSVFIKNQGQCAEASIRFALDSGGTNVGLADRGPRFQLFRIMLRLIPAKHSGDEAKAGSGLYQVLQPPPSEIHEFAMVFDEGAAVTPVGRGRA